MYARGMGDYGGMDPQVFQDHFGHAAPDPHTCIRIQCGAITQAEAGGDLLFDCGNFGYMGPRSCLDPACVGDARPGYCAAGPSLPLVSAGPSLAAPVAASLPMTPPPISRSRANYIDLPSPAPVECDAIAPATSEAVSLCGFVVPIWVAVAGGLGLLAIAARAN